MAYHLAITSDCLMRPFPVTRAIVISTFQRIYTLFTMVLFTRLLPLTEENHITAILTAVNCRRD